MVPTVSQTWCRNGRRIDSEGRAKPRDIQRCADDRNEVATATPIVSCDRSGTECRSYSKRSSECLPNSRRRTAEYTFAGSDHDSSFQPSQEAGQTSLDLRWQRQTEDRR